MQINIELARKCEVAMWNARVLMESLPLPLSGPTVTCMESLVECSDALWTEIEEQQEVEPATSHIRASRLCCALAHIERESMHAAQSL